MFPDGARESMMQYIVCDTDRLSAQDISDRLPDAVEVADYADSLGMVGVRFDPDATPEDYIRFGYAVADLPGGRFPRFRVMGRGK